MCPYSRSVASFAMILVLSLSVTAQAQRQRRNGSTERTNNPASQKQEPKPDGGASGSQAVTLVTPPKPDYLSGEANVAVSGNQNPVIRLALSPNGATIIEFPASDKLFNLIPGNSNLVTIEESPTKETDHFLIVRPGDGFASPTTMAQARRAPATSIIVQMQSGLVLTFLFYPVPQLSEQAHRVVITYDRAEVVAARRAAGLAVNLANPVEDKTKARTVSMRVASPDLPASTTAAQEKPLALASEPQPPRAVADTAEIDNSGYFAKSAFVWNRKTDDPARAASLALTEATKAPDSFRKWSDSVHGLSLSVSPVQQVGKRAQVIVIAVRNTRKSDAHIVPNQPEIYLETRDGKGRPIQIEAVRKLAIETTVTGEVIPGGSVRYYALAYEMPIMGARQKLRVAIGHMAAADEPATTNLTSNR